MTDTTTPSKTLTDLNRDEALHFVTEMVDRYWHSFQQAREGHPAVNDELAESLDIPLPEEGLNAVDVLRHADDVLDKSLSQPRPRFFAFVGSSGLEMGVLADMLASTHDINLAVYAGAANLVEQQALRWVAEFLGYPSHAGTFTSGGMLSNLTALTAARTYALPNSRAEGVQGKLAVYISRDAHSSIERAVEILGIGSNAIRDVSIDEHRRMRPKHLRELIEADIAAGVTPIAIVASAGTTLAGAVDPIHEIANIANDHHIWLHIDGAYGMPAAATDAARPLFEGLEHAHSITVDAHKWLFLPKPCGILLVRDRNYLINAFTHDASYIREETRAQNPVEWTLEYSRPLRALKVWLAFQTYGAAAFRNAIAQNLEQAVLCAKLAEASDSIELLQPPELSVVLFRHLPADPQADINAHNKQLVKALQADGRVYVAGASVDGVDCLRACFVNYRTQDDDVRALIDIVNVVGRTIPPRGLPKG